MIEIIMKNQKTSPNREFIRKAYALQLLNGSFSCPALSEKTGRSCGYTSGIIRSMLSDGLAVCTRKRDVPGPGGSSLNGPPHPEYALTTRGRSLIKVVLSGGVFDIIHPGHIHFLSWARKRGDVLVVVVARDARVKKAKGRLPANNEHDRLEVVSSLRQVDAALLGSEGSCSDTLERVRPDVVCLGHDQKKDIRWTRAYARGPLSHIEISVATPLRGYSTSNILDRCGRAR